MAMKKIKVYIVLCLVLLLILLPLMYIFANLTAFQGTSLGIIALVIFGVISVIYWVIMLIIIKKKDK